MKQIVRPKILVTHTKQWYETGLATKPKIEHTWELVNEVK